MKIRTTHLRTFFSNDTIFKPNVIKSYLGQEETYPESIRKVIEDALKIGTDFHSKMESYIRNNRHLPKDYGGDYVGDCELEKYIEKSFGDDIITGHIDLVTEDGVIYDWKTGSHKADYKYQVWVYMWLNRSEKAIIINHDLLENKKGMHIYFYPGDEVVEDWMDSVIQDLKHELSLVGYEPSN